MKQYDSIPRVDLRGIDHELYTFDKIDGSQIRVTYSYKTGFYKFGSRTQLLDKNDPILGCAIPIFMETLSDPLNKVFRNNNWQQVDLFCELWGEKSLAGRHYPDDKKFITIFDVSIYKQGMMGPKTFLKHFGDLGDRRVPNFLGVHKWDYDFIQKISNSEIEGMGIEGLVGKAGRPLC